MHRWKYCLFLQCNVQSAAAWETVFSVIKLHKDLMQPKMHSLTLFLGKNRNSQVMFRASNSLSFKVRPKLKLAQVSLLKFTVTQRHIRFFWVALNTQTTWLWNKVRKHLSSHLTVKSVSYASKTHPTQRRRHITALLQYPVTSVPVNALTAVIL